MSKNSSPNTKSPSPVSSPSRERFTAERKFPGTDKWAYHQCPKEPWAWFRPECQDFAELTNRTNYHNRAYRANYGVKRIGDDYIVYRRPTIHRVSNFPERLRVNNWRSCLVVGSWFFHPTLSFSTACTNAAFAEGKEWAFRFVRHQHLGPLIYRAA